MDDYLDSKRTPAVIKVVGVGGGGSNAVNRMVEAGLADVEFIAVNTDTQALARCDARVRVRIGIELTHGQGSGGNPDVGAHSAEEQRAELRAALDGADMVFVAAGMGGGTGTGAAPVIAEVARELGALTVAVVTRPFSFEGTRRARVAEAGLQRLSKNVDTLIAIQNDRLLDLVDRSAPLKQAFSVADDILRQGIQGISEIISDAGLINVDFADVDSVMRNGGAALMTIGRAAGEERALAAAEAAVTSPLLDVNVTGAKGVLFNVKGGDDMSLHEVTEAANLIQHTAAPDANIIFGAMVDEPMRGKIQITLIATGFELDERGELAAPEEPLQDVFLPPRAQPQPRAQSPSRAPAQPQSRPTELRMPADNNDLDIPPFLRRKR